MNFAGDVNLRPNYKTSNAPLRQRFYFVQPSLKRERNVSPQRGLLFSNFINIFVKSFKDKKYGIEIPLGSGPKVKKAAIKIAKQFGIKELDKIVKKNFVTYNEVLESI